MSNITDTSGYVARTYEPYTGEAAQFFGFIGVAIAMGFSSVGAAYATAVSARGIMYTWVMCPKVGMRALVPIVMAGIIGIYGLVVSMVVSGKVRTPQEGYTMFQGASHLAAGVACGLCSLGGGYAVGVSGDEGIKAYGRQPKVFVGMVLIWAWAQVLGLYGLLVALVMSK